VPSSTHSAATSYARARHARYIQTGTTYHIISRTHGNLFLLRPDAHGYLRRLVAGILAQAKTNFPTVANFATVLLSNHLHALAAVRFGDPRVLADYIAFVKRELTRRWSSHVKWTGSIWGGYQCTAVISPEAQLAALDYVLLQSVKEGLVGDPREWPGFHCARSLTSGTPEQGVWFDGTAYGKRVHAEAVKKQPREVHRRDFYHPRVFSFDRLPALAHLDDVSYRGEMSRRLDELVVQARRQRGNKRPLGAAAVCAMNPLTSSPVAHPPWFEERRRLIVWDDVRKPEVREYLTRYWEHQRRYREAARAWTSGEKPDISAFPRTAFVPGFRPRPIAHMEQSAA
jgi:REP element-mobilizing transposase RayT